MERLMADQSVKYRLGLPGGRKAAACWRVEAAGASGPLGDAAGEPVAPGEAALVAAGVVVAVGLGGVVGAAVAGALVTAVGATVAAVVGLVAGLGVVGSVAAGNCVAVPGVPVGTGATETQPRRDRATAVTASGARETDERGERRVMGSSAAWEVTRWAIDEVEPAGRPRGSVAAWPRTSRAGRGGPRVGRPLPGEPLR
jgi:hypothetical protein